MRRTPTLVFLAVLAVNISAARRPESAGQPAGGATRVTAPPGLAGFGRTRALRLDHVGGPSVTLDGPTDDEFLFDTSVRFTRTPDAEGAAAAAFDGSRFLVVWTDTRGGSNDIYGTRVTQGGVVVDTPGIPISVGAHSEGFPAVAFDGSSFLVVWEDNRSDVGDIYAARVTPQGAVMERGFPVSSAAGSQSSPAVAFDGTDFLVVWQDWRGSSEAAVYGARVTPQGAVLDPDGIPISTGAGSKRHPAVAWDSVNCLVVWEDTRGGTDDVFGCRVTPEGVVLDSAGFPITTAAGAAGHQGAPSVAFGGGNFLVAWEARDTSLDIYCARVTRQGELLDSSGILVTCSLTRGGEWLPTVAFNGVNFLLVWQDYRYIRYDIFGARVTQDGTVLDRGGIFISRGGSWHEAPALASDGTNCLAVWQEERDSRVPHIYGARVSSEGTVLDPGAILMSRAAHCQRAPAAASGGAEFLAVWADRRSGYDWDVSGMRVTPQGAVLDSAAIPISTAGQDQTSPDVAFDGTNYLAVWRDWRNPADLVYGARVSSRGTVLDPQGFVISTAADSHGRSPAVAFNGDKYLVAWEQYRAGLYDLWGTRVTPAGKVLDSHGFAIAAAEDFQFSPAIAAGSTDWLVVWEDRRSGADLDIYAARVSLNGVVRDPQGIPVCTAARNQSSPAVASDGADWLVVWTDGRCGTADVFAARVTAEGVVLDTGGICVAGGDASQRSPAVAFDGMMYDLVWEHAAGAQYADLRGARLTREGIVQDSFAVVTQDGNQVRPSLAHLPGGGTILVYQGWAGTVAGRTFNTDRIWGKVWPFTGLTEETHMREVRASNRGPTIVRGTLWLPGLGTRPPGIPGDSPQRDSPRISSVMSRALLDVSGRKVMELAPGPNDVRALAPGVYYVRTATGEGRTANSKIVIAR